MKIRFIILFIGLFVWLTSFTQVHHMIGYVDLREATIWVGAEKEANVNLYLSEKGTKKPTRIFSGELIKERGFTCQLAIDGLEPGTTYTYYVSEENESRNDKSTSFEFTTQFLWQYRTDPPSFKLAFGSCAFINEEEYDRPGTPYGGDYQIFESIVAKDPDLMLCLGDNIYLREVDFGSKSGIIHRYQHSRNVPELAKLLHHCPNVAIWDDHDFGPNDSNGSYIHKDWTLEAFKMFWANPSYGLPGKCEETGITTTFSYSDVDFFLLDNRYNRTNPHLIGGAEPTILGNDQIEWLIQSLKLSKAPFKLIAMGGQFLNTEKFNENYSTYPAEREKIIQLITDNNIKGVVFLTGDRHCGEMSKLNLENGNTIYDITVSPLTSKSYDISKEGNTLRVPNTLVPERNFATMEFSGKSKERQMKISVFDSNGQLKYEQVIPE